MKNGRVDATVKRSVTSKGEKQGEENTERGTKVFVRLGCRRAKFSICEVLGGISTY